jgi:DNA-binding response OmpR family regulator
VAAKTAERELRIGRQLRQKLEENPSAPRVVLTEPGVGYRLATDEDV